MAAEEAPGWRYYLQEKILVIFFLGFSSGLPFMLVYSTLTAWLEEASIERSTISTFAWLGLAYSLKFLWAPVVDSLRIPLLTGLLGRRRAWMLLAQVSVISALLYMAGIDPAQNIQLFAVVAFAVAFSSATQDIVVDAYRIECADVRMQGVLAAAYQYGYRIAVITSVAGALYLAEVLPWSTTYRIMAVCMGIGILTTLLCREPESTQRLFDYKGDSLLDKAASWFTHALMEPFADFMKRYGMFAMVLLLFVSLYRISDYVLGILANPFYLDLGYSKSEIATIAKVYGAWVAIVGIGVGGWAVVRYGVARCLVIATALIASTNLFFAAMTVVGPERWMLAVTISADNLAQGFSGTVMIAYLSSLTSLRYTATQYALLSSFAALLPKFTAGYSGDVQEEIGWFGFFLYAALLGVPAILLAILVASKHDDLVRRGNG